jgi:hypothetical protein
MLVADNPRLVGHMDFYNCIDIVFYKLTLAAQARTNAGRNRAVDKIFLSVANLLEAVVAAFHIDVASTASTDSAAVAIDMQAVIFGQIQNIIAPFRRQADGRDTLIFKSKFYYSHCNYIEKSKL